MPCFICWPAGMNRKGDGHGRELDEIAAHFDLLPTMLDVCNIGETPKDGFDGQTLRLSLGIYEPGDEHAGSPGPPQPIIVHSQRVEHPEKWRKCSVMHGIGLHEWRLIDGKELYDLRTDPGQSKDIAAGHPEAVAHLRSVYEKWWTHVSKRFGEYSDIPLGDKHAPAQELCCHDWHPVDEKSPPWNQSGQDGVAKDPLVNGQWAVKVARPGKYAFTLRMRPAGVAYKIPAGKARVKIGDVEGTADIPAAEGSVTITLDLKPTGHVMLQTWLDEADGKSRGAYYTTVKRLEP